MVAAQGHKLLPFDQATASQVDDALPVKQLHLPPDWSGALRGR